MIKRVKAILGFLVLPSVGFGQEEVINQFSDGASEISSLVPLIVGLLATIILVCIIAAVAWTFIRSISSQ